MWHAASELCCGASESLPISGVVTPANERMVRRYLVALTGCAEAVDDLSQEVFLRAIQRIEVVAESDDPERTLRGIARRVAHEFFRVRRRGRRYVDATLDVLAAEDECVAAAMHVRESVELLRAAIDELPIVARRLLELRYHDELGASEIGAEMGIQPTAVRVTLMRIRERLRRRLEAGAASLV